MIKKDDLSVAFKLLHGLNRQYAVAKYHVKSTDLPRFKASAVTRLT
jgi:hypothetical protein